MNAIDKGLYDKLTGDAGLMAAVTGVYNTEAPQGTAEPYVTFQFVADRVEDTFNTTIENVLYDVDIWAADMTTAGTILDLVTGVLDWATLAITGYTTTWCKRVSTRKLIDERDQGSGAHIVATYEVRTYK